MLRTESPRICAYGFGCAGAVKLRDLLMFFMYFLAKRWESKAHSRSCSSRWIGSGQDL